jgi:hypothetical protein
LATSFDVLLSNASSLDVADKWIQAADKLLQWRVANLPSVPECLEAIEFGILLTKAATDAAALFAFRHAGVADDQNPFIATVDEASEKLRFWREAITLTRPENSGATAYMAGPASELPPCNLVEIAYVYSTFLDAVQDVVEISQDLDSPTVMIDYGESHIELRSDWLSRFPPCAELFEIGWLSLEYLDANAGFVSHHIFGFSRERNPFAARLLQASDAFVTWSEIAAARLRESNGTQELPPDEREVAACRPGEFAYMLGFLIPNFRAFVRAGLAIESISDNSVLIKQSFSLRERLWLTLPRCQEALEIGLFMRKILGDWLSMQAAHNILAREDNRYAGQVQRDLDRFLEMSESFANAAEGASQSVVSRTPALIAPERHISLPACASVEQVRTLTLLFEAIEALYSSIADAADIQDLLVFSQTALDIREDRMPLAPLCAENFDYIWLNVQSMSDAVTWYAMLLHGIAREDIPVTDYMVGDLNRIIAWHNRVMQLPPDNEREKVDNANASVTPSCTDADRDFLVSHSIPQFQAFIVSARSASSWAEFQALVEEFIVYRDKLRAGLPRCRKALEIGLAMLKTAGDYVSMHALDYAGAASEDIPYLIQIETNTDLISARNHELINALALDETAAETETTATYYVTANPYANIRTCASTNCDIIGRAQSGEALTVVDASADWYELRLEDGRNAFVAGFLMSATPPDR